MTIQTIYILGGGAQVLKKMVSVNWLAVSVGVILAAILQLILWTWNRSNRKSEIEIVKILFAHWSLWLSRTFLAVGMFEIVKLIQSLLLSSRQLPTVSDNISEQFESLRNLFVCSLFSWCLLYFHYGFRRLDTKTDRRNQTNVSDVSKVSKVSNFSDVPDVSEFACLQQQLNKHKKWFV